MEVKRAEGRNMVASVDAQAEPQLTLYGKEVQVD